MGSCISAKEWTEQLGHSIFILPFYFYHETLTFFFGFPVFLELCFKPPILCSNYCSYVSSSYASSVFGKIFYGEQLQALIFCVQVYGWSSSCSTSSPHEWWVSFLSSTKSPPSSKSNDEALLRIKKVSNELDLSCNGSISRYWIQHLYQPGSYSGWRPNHFLARLVLLVQSCFNYQYFCRSLCIDVSNFVALSFTWSTLFCLKILLTISISKVFHILEYFIIDWFL